MQHAEYELMPKYVLFAHLVYISGGISRGIMIFLYNSSFSQCFENKALHELLMRKISTYVITNPNIAILDMISYTRRVYNYNIFEID
ncbi:MAG: hypothetical protein C4617_02265 [Candidatus Liberibacter europaeus]|uniref:Uncharacterized protein n=1 Tax=Candidatus Liberibacter europaeus TaxID=744859 RepID=A0A2T4VY03_9HYPH|nr:hypothetical protein [Candidatus Liberibacter europaeus]PTL86663.1 MAG: hypothetical protein C4617_02265 [Candidatus Liberibacter europaeus]